MFFYFMYYGRPFSYLLLMPIWPPKKTNVPPKSIYSKPKPRIRLNQLHHLEIKRKASGKGMFRRVWNAPERSLKASQESWNFLESLNQGIA